MDALVGQHIRGYELRERIGAGGFGEVYRAYQPEVDREVAIKVILPEYVNVPEFIRRFEVEAHVIARLEHIHIVPLYDYWREPNGAYLVMRYLPWNMRKALRNGRPSLSTTATWVDQIASGLAAAHRNGIIHRDLKPDNILLDADNNAYLADFGIAKVLTGANIADSELQDSLMGTVQYISPEQIRNSEITPQTDIYSLGILIYEMLAGALPFSGAPNQVIERQLYEPLPPITQKRADLNEKIDAIIHHATFKEPKHRFKDIGILRMEFLEAVRQIEDKLLLISADAVENDPIHGIEADYEPTVAIGHTPVTVNVNPYKGLRAFNEADAFDFFGRAKLITRLIDRLAESVADARLLAVVGPSGSGKTSVVLAGVVPAIRRGTIPGSNRWFEIEMTPGANPIEKLEAALLSVAVDRLPNVADQLRADRNGLINVVKQILPAQTDGSQTLLIVIDQFEDLFVQVDDESSVAHFLALIYTAVTTPGSPIYIILTLRADFYDKPLLYPEFGELLRNQTEVVLPLTPAELTEAIINPAARVGITLEPQLITAIIQDVSAQPGALPLLQYALTELYDRRSGRVLTLESYLATGGVIGALAKRADELFNGLDAESQKLAEQLFLRLVLIGDGADDTRRRVNQTELITIAPDTARLRKIIDVFAEYSLLTIDTDPITRLPTVEIAHEALIRSWDKLRQWLVASREDLTLERSLALTAAEWARNAYNPDYLVVGTRLEQFNMLALKGQIALSESERLFLDKCVARQQEIETQADVALQRKLELGQRAAHLALRADSAQTVAANRLRYLVSVLLVFLIVATGLLLIAVRAAQREAGAARFEESLRFAAEAVNQARAMNGELATLLALRSLNQVYTPQGDAALQLALGVNFTVRVFAPPTIGKQDAALSPDGQTVAMASSGPSSVISLYDARTGQRLKAFAGAPAGMNHISYAHNGAALLTANSDGTVSIWDTSAAIERAHLTVAAVQSAAFSADDQYVLTASGDGTAALWDARTGNQVTRYGGHREGVESAVFSPDGRYVLTASLDGEARVFTRETGQLRYEFVPPGTGERLHSAVFSPNGNYIAAGGYNELVYLWDITSYRLVRILEGHTDEILSVAFAPDGQSIASAGLDLDPILWDATTGTVIRRFIGHDDTVNHVSFSADGARLLTSADNGIVRLWNTGDRPATSADFLRLLKGHLDTVYYAAYSPQGDRIASASKDGTVRIWDVASGIETQHYAGSARIWWLAFAPDGQTLVAAGDDGIAQVMDVKTGLVLQSFRQAGTLWTAAFAPDGVRVITGGQDGIGHIWDVRTGQELVALRGHTDKIYGAAFAPDGKTVVTVSTDKTAILWDAASGTRIRTLTGHTDQIFAVAFSHDGKSIATASRDKTARLWDVSTGAEKWAILGHHDVVWTVQFSSDDKSLLTAGADGTARLWDIATGNEVRRITGHTNAVTSAAFSPDDTWILTTSYDQTIRLTRSSYLALTSAACNRLVRDFSGGERLAFGIQDGAETCTARR